MNSNDQNFTHVREGQPTMVDITEKSANRRTAVAEARMELGAEIIARFQNNDLQGPKGPVFQTAIIAGTMAVKKTRSEERRVGKECQGLCRSRWSPYH